MKCIQSDTCINIPNLWCRSENHNNSRTVLQPSTRCISFFKYRYRRTVVMFARLYLCKPAAARTTHSKSASVFFGIQHIHPVRQQQITTCLLQSAQRKVFEWLVVFTSNKGGVYRTETKLQLVGRVRAWVRADCLSARLFRGSGYVSRRLVSPGEREGGLSLMSHCRKPSWDRQCLSPFEFNL